MKERFVLVFVAVIVLLSVVSAKADDKLSAEEIITKHLDSIAPKEKRDSIKNQLAIGVSEFFIKRGTSSKTIGNAFIASEAGKLMLGTKYNSIDYPIEKVSFDGNKVDIAFINPGIRSPFGNFIFSELAVGDSYIVTVNAKKYPSTNQTRFFQLNDSIGDLEFQLSDAPSRKR